MTSYRFRRRAFLTAVSGGVGLKIMLRNLESSAQGMRSPGRLLVTHWPIGIVAGSNDALWKPTSGSVGGSPGLKPFADAGLGPDMTVIKGVSTNHLNVSGAGSAQQGLVSMVTALAAGGTRTNPIQVDDAFAAPGGSVEQILLERVTALQRPGVGPVYANSIGDSRTCVPFVTEVRATGHERNLIPAMIIGGKQLGFLHDRYVQANISVNDFWGTIAQAFGHPTPDPPFGTPVAGFWAKP